MSLNQIFRTARYWGDLSSLSRGFDDVMRRGSVRVLGRRAGAAMAGMGVVNLFVFAAFLDFLRNAAKQASAKEVWVVNAMRYAEGYDSGFVTIAAGRRLPPPGYRFFTDGIIEAFSTGGRRARIDTVGISRSGLYVGGRFVADIKAIASGQLAHRLGRRAAGRASTAFFFGTLMGQVGNPMIPIAKASVENIRKNINRHGLRDTYALGMATQWGNTLPEAVGKSRAEAIRRLVSGGQSHMETIARKVG